jgi:hypothetical protein
VAKPASSVQRLTPAEVAQRRKDGQCFHCNEFFTNGHKAVCKQLFCIEVIEADDTPTDDTDTLVISIHVLTDIRPHAALCRHQRRSDHRSRGLGVHPQFRGP